MADKNITVTLRFVNELPPSIDSSPLSRTSYCLPTMAYELSVEIIDTVQINWLYVMAYNKSVGLLTNSYTLVPYRLDSLTVVNAYYLPEDEHMVWEVEETVEERLFWSITSKALVINTNESYGGIIDYIAGSKNTIITSAPYDHKIVYESVFLVPLIKGRFITHERHGKEFKAKVEIDVEELKNVF